MEKKLIFEEFPNMHTFVNEMATRPKNEVMESENSSVTGTIEFTGTYSYKEAEALARYGYREIVDRLKTDTRVQKKKLDRICLPNQHAIPKNMVVGYIPNVPNHLLGKPDSMINAIRTPRKVKTIKIIYVMEANFSTPRSLFTKAGPILLTALQFIERNDIRVKLDLCFYFAKANYECAMALVKIKDYGERLDMQRIAFPIAHPSMFRRLGFRWMETSNEITDISWRNGYGSSMIKDRNVSDVINLPPNSYIVTAQQIESMGFNVTKLLKHLNCLK